MTTPILELIDVVKSYGAGPTEVRALTGVSLSIAPGEFVALRGPSGCGKSTLLHLAGGLEVPSAGRVLVGGRDLHAMSATELATLRRGDVGYVFQRLNLVPGLTAAETRDERDVLTVVGASPATIRRTSGLKALVVSAFGVTLALPVGLLPVVLFTQIDPSEPPFVFPWRVVGLLLVGIPVLAAVATTSTSALGLWLRPVRTSTMTFE